MPELPEVETLARDLDLVLREKVVERVRVRRADVLRRVTPRTLGRRVRGQAIVRAWRRAKYAVVDLVSGDRIVVQPAFTGGLLVAGAGAPEDPYEAVRFWLTDGSAFYYRDVRRLGTLALYTPAGFADLDRRLGLEPLDAAFTPARMSVFLRGSAQAVKKLLMDQKRVAGVGNIYANEALWMAGIDPSRAGRTLGEHEVERLHAAVVEVLARAVQARGTSFRDYRDGRGLRGNYAVQLSVYGRAGEPCRRCGTRLASTHAVDARATVFCHRCQR